jgi:hypothetical protein
MYIYLAPIITSFNKSDYKILEIQFIFFSGHLCQRHNFTIHHIFKTKEKNIVSFTANRKTIKTANWSSIRNFCINYFALYCEVVDDFNKTIKFPFTYGYLNGQKFDRSEQAISTHTTMRRCHLWVSTIRIKGNKIELQNWNPIQNLRIH